MANDISLGPSVARTLASMALEVLVSDMYTDLERTIFNVLTAALSSHGISADVINIQDDTTFPSQKNAIRFAKVYDLPNDEAPGGVKSELLTPVLDLSGNITSWKSEEFPTCWNINYKFNLLSESIEVIRSMELILRRTLKHHHALFLYDSRTNMLSDNWCEVSYKGSLNQDNSDLGYYSRATIIRFEIFDYTNIVEVIPAITTINLEVTSGTDQNAVSTQIVSEP
jgi:hypothetical protein